ncbi:hypothetical protein A2U01_0119642, partial [Trifolium medium]|nr:hypothetical protein [Trifolium medium]
VYCAWLGIPQAGRSNQQLQGEQGCLLRQAWPSQS